MSLATVPQSTDFRTYLQEELVRRCKKNPRYSLRSYAKALGISSSALSAILHGKRPLTGKMILRLGSALGITAEEIHAFRSDLKQTQKSADKTTDIQKLTLDTFACISDWYHFAILELIRTKRFKPDTAWIARALGLTRSEVNLAVERLKRVGLLKIDRARGWIDTSGEGKLSNINGDLTSAAAKLMQRQILELAIDALGSQSLDVRSNTAVTVAVAMKDLPEAKDRIRIFRREMAEFFEKAKETDHVFHLAIALYPVSKLES